MKTIVGLECAFHQTCVTVMKGTFLTLLPRLVSLCVMAVVRMAIVRHLMSAHVRQDSKWTTSVCASQFVIMAVRMAGVLPRTCAFVTPVFK